MLIILVFMLNIHHFDKIDLIRIRTSLAVLELKRSFTIFDTVVWLYEQGLIISILHFSRTTIYFTETPSRLTREHNQVRSL